MCVDTDEIREKLVAIFLKRAGKDFQEKGMWAKKLLGTEIRMPVEELMYVYFDIEETYGIQIPEKCLLDGNFDTFGNIYKMINDTLSMSAEEGNDI